MLIYDRSGWMSVRIVSDPKPGVPTASSREGFMASTPADKVTAIDGYYAYCGAWSVNVSASTVTHHIEQSLVPGEIGEDAGRKLSIDGNRLTLSAQTHEMDEDRQRRLVWERGGASSFQVRRGLRRTSPGIRGAKKNASANADAFKPS